MKEKRNTRETLAISLLVISLILITTGTSFAFFNYSRQGTTTNKIETGNLTFVYDESKSNGQGIQLTNAFPMSDTNGKTLTSETEGNVFDFEIRATTQGADINYEIYLTKEEASDLNEDVVKTYLTKVTNPGQGGESETAVIVEPSKDGVNLYSSLKKSQVPDLNGKEARTLYQGTVSKGETGYSESYRFRMWLDSGATGVNQNGEWEYSNKAFKVKVNVYAQNEKLPTPLDA